MAIHILVIFLSYLAIFFVLALIGIKVGLLTEYSDLGKTLEQEMGRFLERFKKRSIDAVYVKRSSQGGISIVRNPTLAENVYLVFDDSKKMRITKVISILPKFHRGHYVADEVLVNTDRPRRSRKSQIISVAEQSARDLGESESEFRDPMLMDESYSQERH